MGEGNVLESQNDAGRCYIIITYTSVIPMDANALVVNIIVQIMKMWCMVFARIRSVVLHANNVGIAAI